MTVKELIDELSIRPMDMEVFIAPRLTTFNFGLLNSVRVNEIDFYETESDIEPIERKTVITLNED